MDSPYSYFAVQWAEYLNFQNISQFSILLLGDRVVIPGSNDMTEDKKIETPFLDYTVKGLLFKTTIIPAVFFQMHCSQKMLEVVEMEIKITTLPCWF